MRCFVAIEFNDSIKRKINEINDKLRALGIKGNYTFEDNLHLTLKFIGEADERMVHTIESAMKIIAAENRSFVLSCKGLGKFNKGSKAILWLGVNHNPNLIKLQGMLQEELNKRLPGNIENTSFSPHITLVREAVLNERSAAGFQQSTVNEGKRDTYSALKEHLSELSLSFNVNGISLMESTRLNGRLRYLQKTFIGLKE